MVTLSAVVEFTTGVKVLDFCWVLEQGDSCKHQIFTKYMSKLIILKTLLESDVTIL
jgi:hypothetical protein